MTSLFRLSILLITGASLYAQDAATVAVTLLDPAGASIPGAHLVLKETTRGTTREATSNLIGYAVFDQVVPGTYRLDVDKKGFTNLQVAEIAVSVRDRQNIRLEMKVGPASQTTVNVSAQLESVSSDPTAGVTMEQDFVQNLPINGRSPEALMLMTPGISSAGGGRAGGGFNSNGLRENTNYYTMDGLSLNSPGATGGGGMMGGGPRGGGGMMGGGPATGPTTDMVSIDALREVRIQTSSMAPEFGRSAGAQVSMVSRSGGNGLHGSLYEYLRNGRFNANDWFANNTGLARGDMKQNRFGGVVGGNLRRDKTFFFMAYEGLRLVEPTTVIADVPDATVRASAKATMRPFLAAFPIGNGAKLTGGAQEFRSVVTNPTHNDSASLRLDHSISSTLTAFVRYSYLRSSSTSRGSEFTAPNVLSTPHSTSQNITAGLTKIMSGGSVNDLRFNVSRANTDSSTTMDRFGGAQLLTDSQLFPRGITSATGQFSLNVQGMAGYSLGARMRNQQKQLNVIDSLTKATGRHHYKVGFDARYIAPTYFRKPYTESIVFRSLATSPNGTLTDSFLNGIATNVMVASNVPEVYPAYFNFSAYAQDTFRVTDRTTITYGLRWDVNPAPTARKGPKPFALASDSIAGVTQNDPLYPTRWHDIAPRLGLSYLLDDTQGKELIFRFGTGLFYDLGYGMTGAAFSGAPYSSVRNLTSAVFPLATSDMAAPALPPTRPYGQITAAEVGLVSPHILQVSGALERNFGSRQSLTVGYAATRGSKLLRTETQPTFSNAYSVLMVTTNGATSNYNGMQMQFRRRMSATLQTQISYTWSHSIDTASNDMGGGGFATLYGNGERGNSDYDIRHNLSFSGSYLLPAPRKGPVSLLFNGWYLDWALTARNGLPFDVQGISTSTSTSTTSSAGTSNAAEQRGIFAQVRPDYNGLPVWIDDSKVPGGQRVNSLAFVAPSGYNQGNLGRNALRGFGMNQLDFAFRRQISLGERRALNLSAQAFNVMNHPNFANLSAQQGANLSSPNFGIVTRMLNQGMMGGGSTMYRNGGARQVEFALRLQF